MSLLFGLKTCWLLYDILSWANLLVVSFTLLYRVESYNFLLSIDIKRRTYVYNSKHILNLDSFTITSSQKHYSDQLSAVEIHKYVQLFRVPCLSLLCPYLRLCNNEPLSFRHVSLSVTGTGGGRMPGLCVPLICDRFRLSADLTQKITMKCQRFRAIFNKNNFWKR